MMYLICSFLGRNSVHSSFLSKDPAELLAIYWIFIYLPHRNRTDNFSEKIIISSWPTKLKIFHLFGFLNS